MRTMVAITDPLNMATIMYLYYFQGASQKTTLPKRAGEEILSITSINNDQLKEEMGNTFGTQKGKENF